MKLFIFLLLISAFRPQLRGQNILVSEKIIFDTDMGSDCDDAGALALLHAYATLGKAEIIGCIYSSGVVPYGAAVIEAINVYYGRPDIPVGACHGSEVGDPVDKMNAEKLAKDISAFGNRIIHNLDAEEQTRLNRRLLSSQPDSSVTYITVGHTKGLYDLLISTPDDISPLNGKELIEKKIRRWVALGALGAYHDGEWMVKDWNFFFNGTAPYSQYLVEYFPMPVFFVDGGNKVMTGKSLRESPSGNIVRTAYRDWLWNVEKKILDDQRPSWDLVTVYFAVEGLGEYFETAEPCWLEMDAEKGCKWRIGETRYKHNFIRQKPGTDSLFAGYLNDLISRLPER